VKGENDSLNEAIRVAKQKRAADVDTIDSNAQVADSYNNVTEEVDGVVTSLQDLAKELDAANNAQLDAREAARNLQAAYDDFDATIKKNGTSLNIHTAKGRENQAALDEMARAALKSADAILETTGSQDAYRESLESSRKAILDRIRDLGLHGEKAQELADKILNIPSETEFKLYANTDKAQKKLDKIIRAMNLINSGFNQSKSFTVSGGIGDQIANANGGIVKFYANGGVEHHSAQIAKAGTTRVWAEPETGGEAYIPLTPTKRPRATQVLAQVASDFGYQLVPVGAQLFADGSGTGNGRSIIGRDKPVEITGRLDLGGGLTGVITAHLNNLQI
jgi:flagellin-specific chaperone FliS